MSLRFIIPFLFPSLAMAFENYGEWRYSKQLNMNADGLSLSAPIHDFPLLVRLNAGNFDFGAARPDGHDLRFTRSDGLTRLPHQVERWDAAAREAEVWVLVDTVRRAGLTSLRMYFGNPGAADGSDGVAVFDTAHGHRAVFHLGEGTGDTARDATRNGFFGIPRDTASRGVPSDAPGVIGRAKEFAGGGPNTTITGGYYTLPGSASGPLNLPENGPYTISAWVKLRPGATTNAFRCIVSKSDFQYNLMKNNVANEWQFNPFSSTDGTPSRWERATGGPVNAGEWQYVVGIRHADNSESLYVDGVPSTVIVNSNSGSPRSTAFDVMIGRRSDFVAGTSNNGNRFWDGWIDEVRISSGARGADWIRLSYETQRPGAAIVSFGEPVGGTRLTGPEGASRWDYVYDFDSRLHYNRGLTLHGAMSDSARFIRAQYASDSMGIEAIDLYGNPSYRVSVTPDSIVLTEIYTSFHEPEPVQVARTAFSAQRVETPNLAAPSADIDTLRAGRVLATHVVSTPTWRIPDYVFEPGYARRSLAEIETFVRSRRHLPDIPSAREIETSGLDLAEMSLRLLKSVEELTLHVIDLDKKNTRLEEEIGNLRTIGREARK